MLTLKLMMVLAVLGIIALSVFMYRQICPRKKENHKLPERKDVQEATENILAIEPQISITVTHGENIDDEVKYFYEPTKETKDFIKALIFIGKADGQLREVECSIIYDYLIVAQPEHKDTYAEYIISRIRETRQYSSREYKNFLNNLTSDRMQELLKWSARIVNTQKSIHPFEEYLLEEISNRLNTPAVDAC